MENLNDPRNIKGMADILVDDDDIDIDDIERSIITGTSQLKQNKPVDLAKEYDKELEQLSRQFNLGDIGGSNLTDDADDLLKENIVDDQFNMNEDNNGDDGNDRDAQWSAVQSRPTDGEKQWSLSKPADPQLSRMTIEERKQTHINKVLSGIEKTDDDQNFIQEEEEEDEMARILEQVDLLKTNLEAEGVDLSRIPNVDANSSKKEAKAVLRILQIKNDRLRYCDMFEEGILAVAYGLEGVFDGKKEWFGNKIDLVGWPETVKVKLRRMRYDTSTFIGDVMKGYNIGSGWRIIFELLPSLFLYSRDRRLRNNDNLISDDKYKDAIRDLTH